MRLKTHVWRENSHRGMVCAVGWTTGDEMVSLGDDQQMLRWNLTTSEASQVAQMKPNVYPTAMHWYPRGSQRQTPANDVFLLSCTDGKILIISSIGKVEKTIDAHKGAVFRSTWSYDGTGFVSCGEDGNVKMWSRNGMLRSVLATTGRPIYGVEWSADGSRVLYCSGELCYVKAFKTQMSAIKWKAHDGIILCVSWSSQSGLIASGSEDCRYKVWDSLGRPLFSSGPHEYPITSLAWNLDGDLFAVGSFNLIRLCDQHGWSHSLEKLQTGSLMNFAWSPDGTQIVAGCTNGLITRSHIVDRHVWWNNLEATQTKHKTITVKDVKSEVAKETLELRDRITKMSLGYEHLVVATTKQCYIYSSKNWNTPSIFELKENAVTLLLICEKFILMVDGSLILVVTFEGRIQTQIKLPGTVTSGEPITARTAGISNDAVVVRDRIDSKTIHLFETQTGKIVGSGKIVHQSEVVELRIDQCGPSMGRKIAFVDVNADLFIAIVNTFGESQRVLKIGALIHNIHFNDVNNMLIGLQDATILVWTYPSIVFADKQLLQRTSVTVDNGADVGKSPQIYNFHGNHILVRRADGALVELLLAPFFAGLVDLIGESKWDKAIKLCRLAKDDSLWALLAGFAAAEKNFYAAEIAYAEINEAEKVVFLNDLRGESNPRMKNAQMVAFSGKIQDYESALTRSGDSFRAIMTAISIFQWDRALDLALKEKSFLDIVIGYRQRYLKEMGLKETDKRFIAHISDVEIDWNHIREKIAEESAKERR
ncbi:hypothetical protein L596_014953 [Steinernema carpocapsae]|uniref:Anaphase-promoting complex subunit 4 WD40 domain-containing protein n=1 Tax=Steinernema carpocapsae TaxID=34508 RepID=A0A4U5NER3_STECR|nr:hypothetical protein L596_014953 [Steinernema carpocapsae]